MTDALAYYTWFHATALAITIIGGAITFVMYFTRKYDGGKNVPGYEWRRGTGHGTYAGKVTVADLYSRNNKWKSYRKHWEKVGRFLCFCGTVFFFLIAMVFPQIATRGLSEASYPWAEAYDIAFSNHVTAS